MCAAFKCPPFSDANPTDTSHRNETKTTRVCLPSRPIFLRISSPSQTRQSDVVRTTKSRSSSAGRSFTSFQIKSWAPCRRARNCQSNTEQASTSSSNTAKRANWAFPEASKSPVPLYKLTPSKGSVRQTKKWKLKGNRIFWNFLASIRPYQRCHRP
jgi:hypothetical protein